jgi:SAM-dependent methyltransferase
MNEISREFNPSITQPHYFIRNRLLNTIRLLAPQLEGRMIDFGCGQKPYKTLFTVNEYIGVDFDNPGHPHGQEAIDVFYDGKTIPFPDAYFDSVFSSEVFEHIFNLPEILRELNRVLKPGGKILITCPFAFCEHEVPNDFARYSSYAIHYLMTSNGFEVMEQVKTGNSSETISQLLLMYLHQHMYPKLKNIPLVRSAFRLFFYTTINLITILMSRILPSGKDLYMNNVLLCKKSNNPVP